MMCRRKVSICVLLVCCLWICETLGQELGEDQFVNTPDGGKIRCLVSGDSEAAVKILFVPGWCMPAEIWEHQIRQMRDRFRVIAMDPRSQGKSSKMPSGHHPAKRAKDIRAIVEQLKLDPVVIVAWSLAVVEAISYVHQYGGDGVLGLVMVDGTSGGVSPEVRDSLLQSAFGLQSNPDAMIAGFVRGLFSRSPGEEYLEWLTAEVRKTPLDAATVMILNMAFLDLSVELSKINCPVLLTAAGRGDLVSAMDRMNKELKVSSMEIFDDSSHALFVDAPVRFNRSLERFINRLPSVKN